MKIEKEYKLGSKRSKSSGGKKQLQRLKRQRKMKQVQHEAEHDEESDEEDEDDVDDDVDGGDGAESDCNGEIPLIQKLLPGHKIARGRGRRKQLEMMTEEEKEAEKAARMEKMRISARECRLRKKNNIATLETKLRAFEQKDKRNKATINRLRDEMRRLQENLRALSGVRNLQSPGSAHAHVLIPSPRTHSHELTMQPHHQHPHHQLGEQPQHQQRVPAVVAQLREGTFDQNQHRPVGDLASRRTQLATKRPSLSFANSAGTRPAMLDFAGMNHAGEHESQRLVAPQTPLTPQLHFDELLAPQFSPNIAGSPPFSFDDAEHMMLG
jgi:hypothetical protein